MTDKSTSHFETMREISKEKIMSAALSLFSSVGYFSTSVSKIAQNAGISKGLMYNYFQSKEHLLRSLIDKVIKLMDSSVPDNIKEIDPKDRVAKVLNNIFNTVEKHKVFMRMMTSMAFKVTHFDFMADIMEQQYKHYIDIFTEFFEAVNSNNPEGEARILMATMDGIFFQYYVLGDKYPYESIKKDLLKKYQF